MRLLLLSWPFHVAHAYIRKGDSRFAFSRLRLSSSVTGPVDSTVLHTPPSTLGVIDDSYALNYTAYFDSLKEYIQQITPQNSYLAVRDIVEKIFQLDSVRPISEKLWYVILDATLKRRSDTFAIDIFRHMHKLCIVCSNHQLTSLLLIANERLTQDECLQIFDDAVSIGVEPTVQNFSPLLKMAGSARRARLILARMQLSKIEPNVISFSAAIKSCEQMSDWRSAIELLELMKAVGIKPNEITYCCIISAASKGWAGDVAVNILREMESNGVAPNALCYACALTACAKCKEWNLVETLFNEMYHLHIPIQESIVISVVNCCRSSVRPPKLPIDSNGNEWAKAIWIVNMWASRAEGVTESLYTIAMDVCQDAGRFNEVVQLYFHMEQRIGGPKSKSSLTFALKACERLKDPTLALRLLRSACAHKICSNTIVASTLASCIGLGRVDLALEAYKIAYEEELSSELKQLPTPNTQRLVRALMDFLVTNETRPNATASSRVLNRIRNGDKSVNVPISASKLYKETVIIVMKTLRSQKPALEQDDCERVVRLMAQWQDYDSLRYFFRLGVASTLNKGFIALYEYMVETLCFEAPLETAVNVVLQMTIDLQGRLKTNKRRQSNLVILHTMSFLYNNITIPSATNVDEYKGTGVSTGYSSSKIVKDYKEKLIFTLFREGRKASNNASGDAIPVRMYRLAALACRDKKLFDEMFELYQNCIEDDIADRTVFSHAIYILSKSPEHAAYCFEIFERIRLLDSSPPDSYVYTSALVACETCKDWKQALVLLNSMQKDGHALNTFAMTTAIAVCAGSGKTDEALGLLKFMQNKRIECSVWTFNAAMFGCAKVGRWRDALAVFESMRTYVDKKKADASSGKSSGNMSSDSLHTTLNAEDNSLVMATALREISNYDSEDTEVGGDGSDEEEDDEDDYESYMESFDIANIVTYNTLIEALGEGGQFMLVDDIYRDAVQKGIVNPFRDFKSRGWVDLHYHSVHMGNAALRYLFEDMKSDPSVLNGDGACNREITVIVGKGSKLQRVVEMQLKNEFRPAIRANVCVGNIGRLRLDLEDVRFWLQTHKNLSVAHEDDGAVDAVF